MQKLPLRLAEPGMVLAKPVTRGNGLVVAAEGTELTQGIISGLERMEIESIVVEGNPVDMDGIAGGIRYEKRIERLDHLFRKYEDDQYMMRLKTSIKKYFQIKSAAEGTAVGAETDE